MRASLRQLSIAFIIASALLCAPSYAAWFRRPFDIGVLEFDPWLGLVGTLWPARLSHAVLFGVIGALYIAICRHSAKPPRWLVPAAWLTYFLAVPWISPDVFFYLAKGWMEAKYGLNPYLVSVAEVPGFMSDPMLMSMTPALHRLLGNYGPLFQKLSALIAWTAGGSPVVGLVLFKLLFAGALWGCYRLVRRLAARAGGDAGATDNWFLLNPLILFNFLTAAHNDVLLMLMVLSSVLAIISKRAFLAGVLIGLSISFKLVGLFLLPALALYVLLAEGWVGARRRWPVAISGTVIGAIGGAAVDPTSIAFYRSTVAPDTQRFRSSIHMIASPMLEEFGVLAPWDSLLIGKVVFVVIGGVLLWLCMRRYRGMPTVFLLVCCFQLLLVAQYIVMPAMTEWYIFWPLCFALCVPDEATRQWCRRVTLMYMPIVVWHVVGPIEVIAFAQLTILGILTFATTAYFVRTLSMAEPR